MATAPPSTDIPLIGTAQPPNLRRRRLWIIGAVILVAIAAIVFGGGVGQSWEGLGQNLGHPLSLAVVPQHPEMVFCGIEGGKVLATTDGGQHWIAPQSGFPAESVVSALITNADGSRIYAGTNHGVLLSTDNGLNWTTLGKGLPADTIESLSLGSSDGTTIFAGTPDHGAYVTRDSGQSWAAVGAGFPAKAGVYTLAATPDYSQVYAGLIGAGIFVTADGGQSWTAVNAGLPAGINVFTIAFAQAGQGKIATIYAGTNLGVYAMADGATWKPMGAGLGQTRVLSLVIDPLTSALLVAGTDTGVFESTDGGLHWKTIASGLPAGEHVGAVVISRPNRGPAVVYAAAGQIYRYPGQGLLAIVGGARIVGFLLIAGLLIWVTLRQRRLLAAMLPANEPPPGYRPRAAIEQSRRAAQAHIRGGPPPVGTVFPSAGGPMTLHVRSGAVAAIFTPLPGTRRAAIMVGEGRHQPHDGPNGAFALLATALRDHDILSLRLAFQPSKDLAAAVEDITGTLDILARHGIRDAIVIGWGTGAIAARMTANHELVRGVVALALPEPGHGAEITSRSSALLLIHGSDDFIAPVRMAREAFATAAEPKELLVIPGADHTFDGQASVVIAHITQWADTILAPPDHETRS